MADFLIYWKDFWKDRDEGNTDFDEKWHTNQKHFYNKVQENDILWFVVSDKDSDKWRLISQIIVRKKDIDLQKEKIYGVFANKKLSQKFDVEFQSDFTPILHKLEFKSGKKLKVEGKSIGQAIQKIRPLSESDSFFLKNYSKNLKLRNN